ncbi:hypothetical protein [Bdellovibrio bacteriovorus]|uniref:hypothetical protein n=1 Tax=Bdellovibrio bacteriovorus TaxID=959 RepID=UPI0035A99CF8
MKKSILGLILGSLFVSTSFAGVCKTYVAEKNSGFFSTRPKIIVLDEIRTNYGGCLDLVIGEYAKLGRTAYARYSSSGEVPLDGPIAADFSAYIVASHSQKIEGGPLSWRGKSTGCFARADYRSLLKGTFSSHHGKVLNPSGQSPQECMKSAVDNYTMETARGTSLRSMEVNFQLDGQIGVQSGMTLEIEDAGFLRDMFKSEFMPIYE